MIQIHWCPGKQEQRYTEKGIDAFHGLARFTGPDTVTVEGQELKARYILLASGARPVASPQFGEFLVAAAEERA